MHVVFSMLFWAYLAISSIALFFVALVIWVVTLPFDRNRVVLHYFTSLWAYHYVWLNPMWSVRFEGREHLRAAGRTAVIVANHQSLGDILILFGLFWPFKWVSKRSVLAVPFIGWNMRLNGYVPLLRGDKQSIGEMMDACRRWLRRGASIMMFPEGTRSPDGEMKAFKTGAFTMATEADLPVVPIVIDGTRDALPKHGFVLRTKCRMRVRILPPVRGKDMAVLLEETRQRILAELTAMRAATA